LEKVNLRDVYEKVINGMLKQKLEGNYTVEATAIFGISIGLIFLMIALGFRVYYVYTEEISEREVRVENPTETFRMISFGKVVLEEVIK
jgi:hypothetical protein